MKKQKNKIDNHFLPDWPLTADQSLETRFGHPEIAKTLTKLLLSCRKPFTAGLFGEWGTGKTTIINFVVDSVKKTAQVAVVVFDVWKHEGDGLRRFFLKDLVVQLKESGDLPRDFKLREELESSVTRTGQGKLRLNKASTGNFVLIAAVLVLAVLLGYSLHGTPGFALYLSIVFSLPIGGVLLMLLYQAGTQVLTTETTTFGRDRFQDAHEFQDEFYRILSSLKEAGLERLIIVIDNLDRCTHEKAIELLSTLKTYLAKDRDEQNNCVFLIACDEQAIGEHIRSVYKLENDTKSSGEFLRKFFNVSITIPNFIDTELYTYTEALLKETAIPALEDSNVAFIITTAFRANPREIKQFINILSARFLLAEEREASKLIVRKGAVTSNPAFLAKILVIQDKFKEQYQKVVETGRLEWDTQNVQPGYDDFFRATRTITANVVRPFIFLKQSHEELVLPDAEKLELSLLENNADEAKKLVMEALKREFGSELERFVLSLISKNERRLAYLFNIVSTILATLHNQPVNFSSHFYNKVASLLVADHELRPELINFDPTVIFESLVFQCDQADKKKLLDDYVRLLGEPKEEEKKGLTPENLTKIFCQFRDNKDHLEQDQITKLSAILNGKYSGDREVLGIFRNDDEIRAFVSEEVLTGLIIALSVEDSSSEQLSSKIEFAQRFSIVARHLAANTAISKAIELMRAAAGLESPLKLALVAEIKQLLRAFSESIESLEDKELLGQLASITYECAITEPDWDARKIYLSLLMQNRPFVPEAISQRAAEIDGFIREFFVNASFHAIEEVFIETGDEIAAQVVTDLSDVFQQRIQSDQAIFELSYAVANKDQRTQWLENLLNSEQWEIGLTKLESLSFNVDDPQRTANTLLAVASNATLDNKVRLFDAAKKLGLADSDEAIVEYLSQIKALLIDPNPDAQNIGADAIRGGHGISGLKIGTLIREVVEWLRGLDISESYQPSPIKTVYEHWKTTDRLVKEEFIDFVLDKLITRATTLESMRLGFECLCAMTPRPGYAQNEAHFKRILDRAKTESDQELAQQLKDGLGAMKPSRISAQQKGFWEQVDQLADEDQLVSPIA